jgi:Ca-activated chloride channel family protein
MNDDRLNRLKNVSVPPPSEKAKMAALESAMSAFDAAGESEAAPEVAENSASAQGSASAPRPKTSFIAKAWSWFMDTRLLSAPVAATLIILPVAGYVAVQFARDYREPAAVEQFGQVESALKVDKLEGDAPPTLNEQSSARPKAADDRVVSLDGLADQAAPAPVAQVDEAKRRVDDLALGQSRRQAEDKRMTANALRKIPAAPAADPQLAIEAPSDGKAAPRSGGSGGGGLMSMSAPSSSTGNRAVVGAGSSEEQKFRFGGGRLCCPTGNAVTREQEQRIGRLVRPLPQRERDIAVPEKLEDRDQFESFDDNDAKTVADEPVTTFSVDVDTASYAFVRRSLESGRMPPHDAVRVEELINYFSYDYPAPEDAEEPFRASVALYPTPWNPQTRLMHIGIKGYDVTPEIRPASNLVFLIDVSGSMNQPDKLPLLKNAFRMLVGELGPEDTVSIVTYAGQAGVVLEPTEAKEKRRILAAIDKLRPGGRTAGAAGIEQAYALADEAFKEDGVNRVILATDGDFNVGISNPDDLKRFIEKKRRSGTFLSVVGFGQGNYNDALMQSLAQNGNGVAAYIDSLNEAQKVLVEEASANLFPIAKDVKIQIEFNPARVSEYRLIGYETRALRNQDFANDKVDAGDIGSGHTVTAIYELTLTGSATSQLDERRYAEPSDEVRAEPAHSGEYAFLKLRYKLPKEDRSKLVTLPVTDALAADGTDVLSDDMRFAAAVAAFGQKLRGNRALDDYGYDEIADLAASARGADPFGYRGAFLSLVRLAGSLDR